MKESVTHTLFILNELSYTMKNISESSGRQKEYISNQENKKYDIDKKGRKHGMKDMRKGETCQQHFVKNMVLKA